MKMPEAWSYFLRKSPRKVVIAAMLAALLPGCNERVDHRRAVFVLIDISSDYASELEKAQTLNNYLLSNLRSGDSLAVAFIDNSSFTERNIIAKATFDYRPSAAITQKRAIRSKLNSFVKDFRVPSYHSDISGGMFLATDYLQDTDAGQRYLFILSDLHEDLPPQLKRDITMNLNGIEVFAVNVKRQRSDNNDPQAYQKRLTVWQQRVEVSGGRWQVVSNLGRLESALALR